ncbi:MAG: phosphoribosylformylglycinamidine synthase II, partial [Acidobacteria bacterium]|nr:phosphoribosylformylglycinamidine synthase II [Acidobacteriota bacterium]
GLVRGLPPDLDLARERALQQLVVQLAALGLLGSGHDCSDGGLAVTIAECCFDTAGTGAEVNLPEIAGIKSIDAVLFGETASQVIVSIRHEHLERVMTLARRASVPASAIGRTGGTRIRIAVAGAPVVDLPVEEAEHVWATAIERRLEARAA